MPLKYIKTNQLYQFVSENNNGAVVEIINSNIGYVSFVIKMPGIINNINYYTQKSVTDILILNGDQIVVSLIDFSNNFIEYKEKCSPVKNRLLSIE